MQSMWSHECCRKWIPVISSRQQVSGNCQSTVDTIANWLFLPRIGRMSRLQPIPVERREIIVSLLQRRTRSLYGGSAFKIDGLGLTECRQVKRVCLVRMISSTSFEDNFGHSSEANCVYADSLIGCEAVRYERLKQSGRWRRLVQRPVCVEIFVD